VKSWLFIAGLYRRASLFEDAREACDEASEQASRFEALVATQESSARSFADVGWGVGKSSDELWADVYAERGCLALAQSQPYDAIKHFEEAVMYFPDHPSATVGLSNLLLDIYAQILPAEPAEPDLTPNISSLSFSSPLASSGNYPQLSTGPASSKKAGDTDTSADTGEISPESLDRLAARDRAYGLLSTLTKLGIAWDNSEAWFSLSRAYEEGGQIDKAKEVLWWCIELEDRKPIRHWWNLGYGGYVL
jgi:tetratricopeptide (TPR) repeat protein